MAKTPKTTTDKTEIDTPAAATEPASATATVVDATADTAPATVAPAAAPAEPTPVAPPAVATPDAVGNPPAPDAPPVAPPAVEYAPPTPVTTDLPVCCTCGKGVEIDEGFATEGLFMAVTTKTTVESVHSSNHVSRPIRNFHFRCAAELIIKAVKDRRAI